MERRHIIGKALHVKQRKRHAAIGAMYKGGKTTGWERKGKPLDNYNRPVVQSNLKDGKTGLAEVVKSTPRLFILEAAAKNLHSEQGENEYKEDEKDEQRIDGCYGVDQTLDQITHGGPISVIKELKVRKGGMGTGLAEGQGLLIADKTHRVTLKALRSLIHRSTERPTGGISSWLTRTNSMIELTTTTKSNLGVVKRN